MSRDDRGVYTWNCGLEDADLDNAQVVAAFNLALQKDRTGELMNLGTIEPSVMEPADVLKYLGHSVNHRGLVLAGVVKEGNVTRRQAKDLFIRIMLGGTERGWARDVGRLGRW